MRERESEVKMTSMATILHCKLTLIKPGVTWAYDMNFVMNHVPGAGSIATDSEVEAGDSGARGTIEARHNENDLG